MGYLEVYNAASVVAWLAVLVNPDYLIPVQVVNSVLELVHIAGGLVRAPLSAALMQCYARLGMCLGVLWNQKQWAPEWAFRAMIFAWGITEVIRYTYYLVKRGTWLRYSAFIVLYPLGLISEATIAWSVLPHVTHWFQKWFLYVGLAMYLPGFVMLYSYMWKQRRKQLGPKRKQI
ncbi:hypothetical protein DIURU_005124 [Diutina rugosa]|uniref:Very-long-chain (3R)-3-hydroxyacyl-CoA dehydratase n=1 Tax=Diutina rugosa TaxID=5481 RepID=A0A642UET3_DIURU|nr:uncharacterized protein DIURU_005124 [Diutina rugosa]KAA8897693.1 hypothetical protein DIURU_005124 [Diutina rugosa]